MPRLGPTGDRVQPLLEFTPRKRQRVRRTPPQEGLTREYGAYGNQKCCRRLQNESFALPG
jgi:hypothetical protein